MFREVEPIDEIGVMKLAFRADEDVFRCETLDLKQQNCIPRLKPYSELRLVVLDGF